MIEKEKANIYYRTDTVRDAIDYGTNVRKYIALSELTKNLNLNKSYNIGNLSHLLRQKHFKTFKDWVAYYMKTGEESLEGRRNGTLDPKMYGRTKEEIIALVDVLYNKITTDTWYIEKYFPLLKDTTYNQCYLSLTFLILGHSWNGIIIRENNVMLNLMLDEGLKEYTFEQSTPEQDITYGVDIVVKKNGVTVAGIQVKPEKYLFYNQPTPEYAKKQHEKFKQRYNVTQVSYVYADDLGKIHPSSSFVVL